MRNLTTVQGIHEELLHRAWQVRAAASIGRTSKQRTESSEYAARELENVAEDIARAALRQVAETQTK